MLRNFGETTNLKTKETKTKIRETNLKKYKKEYATQSKQVKEKTKSTNKRKYNASYFFQSKKYKKQIFKSMLNRLDNYLKLSKIKRLFLDSDYTVSYIFVKGKRKVIEYNFECLKCGHQFQESVTDGRYPVCHNCSKAKGGTSKLEDIFESFLKENNITYKRNVRSIISPLELDFFIEDLNIAIEIHGLYYHSKNHLNKTKFNEQIYIDHNLEPNKGKNLHLLKHILCENKNIQLIQLYEDELMFNFDLIQSMILNKLKKTKKKIYARKCYIKEVDSKKAKDFLDKNHIQGNAYAKTNLGLYFNDKLISLMTFSKYRFSKKTDDQTQELIRYSVEQGYSIIGGASKLLKYFIKTHNVKSIISFADRRYSNGNLYKKLNFNKEYITPPQFKYIKQTRSFNRRTFTKKNIEYLYNLYKNEKIEFKGYGLIKVFDENLTAEEIMLANGYNKIYDAGLIKYKLEVEQWEKK